MSTYAESGAVCRLRGDQFVIIDRTGDTNSPEKQAKSVLRKIRSHDWSVMSPNLFVTVTGSIAHRRRGEQAPTLMLRAIIGVEGLAVRW
ncbi:hypothetical protein Ssi03_00900 [Sphaerisporangium siamense]|nr:hypothetical protein Ssi03_00900 [Sphaerisporangium siamense]